ncbi:hypothetical protein [Campylobacter gastrosuis]|uniref:Acetyltransferase n=1 Tax=Campylobacter gastrosuis TaxID=2974576 RepID=A0ABT7HMT4_9BACT|nr:hypothetical protein [Campylobacter gastrosuis]MDL0087811.1 hypothetical protein [Campylobacter gastrosuis]MDL0088022.1 hypothetical protein [Campylobacter gastrosuis]
MQIKVNKFVREYLENFNVLLTYPNGKISRFKDDEIINVPQNGFMEEFSTINKGTNICAMGSFSYSNAIIPSIEIKIGRYCSIANGFSLIATKHPLQTISTSSFTYDPNFYIFKDGAINKIGKSFEFIPHNKLVPPPTPTILENDVYICTNALIKPGITLHTGCVVAQNAIVTKDVPPYAVVGGSPARILKYRFDESTIKRLLALKWWEYHFADFNGISLEKNINFYLDELEKKISNKQITPFKAQKMDFSELINRSKQQILTPITKPAPTPEQLKITKLESENLALKDENLALKNEIKKLKFNLEFGTAKDRIKNHLSYKLGFAIQNCQKSPFGVIKMPFILSYITALHKNEKPAKNHPKLNEYPDYKEALKIKDTKTYKIGLRLINMGKSGKIWG